MTNTGQFPAGNSPGGWQGSRSPGEVPRLTINLSGFRLDPAMRRLLSARLAGSGTYRYVESPSGFLEVHLYRDREESDVAGVLPAFVCGFRHAEEGGSEPPPADFSLSVDPYQGINARRAFSAPDRETASAFIMSILSLLQGGGAICLDLVDLLMAWQPFVTHGMAHRADLDSGKSLGPPTSVTALFILAPAEDFSVALVDRVAGSVGMDGEVGTAVIGYVGLADNQPISALIVW